MLLREPVCLPRPKTRATAAQAMRRWPLRTVHTLDKSRPMQQTVLGMDVVIWWSEPEQRWNVFQDACPHRMAPLSHGRITDGQLSCAYHVRRC